MIRVLVAEDSPTARQLLVAVLSADPEIEVIGQATNGRDAIEFARRLAPDVITMDVNMPVMDGLAATRQIMIEVPTPIVMVSATYDAREIVVSMQALRLGALAALSKPAGPGAPAFAEDCRRLIETVKAMAGVKVVHHRPDRPTGSAGPAQIARRAPPEVVGIAASTGGPAALQVILSGLPASFPVPLLVVQHIGRDFAAGLAAWLGTVSPLRIKVSTDGERLTPATVYIGAEGHHLGVTADGRVRHAREPAIGGFRPSASYLFESIARAFGAGALGVVLTGMGRDGAAAMATMKACGGGVIAQDEVTSVVFGMPRAAIETGCVDAVLPLDAMARQLLAMATNRSPP